MGDERMATTPEARAPMGTGMGAGGVAGRVVLTLLGAAGLIIGSFLTWVTFQGARFGKGTELPVKVFWSTGATNLAGSFVASAGFVTIVIGLLALLGLAFRSGWLTRLAGALGVAAFILFLITMYRVPGLSLGIGNAGIGLWIVLVGGIVALVGGFFGTRAKA